MKLCRLIFIFMFTFLRQPWQGKEYLREHFQLNNNWHEVETLLLGSEYLEESLRFTRPFIPQGFVVAFVIDQFDYRANKLYFFIDIKHSNGKYKSTIIF